MGNMSQMPQYDAHNHPSLDMPKSKKPWDTVTRPDTADMAINGTDLAGNMKDYSNDVEMDADPSGNVPPGGRAMTDLGQAAGDKMQSSNEGGRTYKGNAVYSEVKENVWKMEA